MTLTLLSAGSNAHGQLAHSSNEDSHTFLPCQFLGSPANKLPSNATQLLDVATGANHTLILLQLSPVNDKPGGRRIREVWGCGDGRAGQLGRKYQEFLDVARASGKPFQTDVFRKLELDLEAEGLEGYEPKAISAGWETSYITLSTSNGNMSDVLVSFGSDDFGDLGIGGLAKRKGKEARKELNRIDFSHLLPDGALVSIVGLSANQHHVVVHIRAGEKGWVVGWGAARHGQIGVPPTVGSKPAPTVGKPQLMMVEDMNDPFVSLSVGSQHSVLLRSSGKLVGLGSNRKGQLDVVHLENVKAVSCTWNGTFALVEKDTTWRVHGTGSNTHGQLGRGIGSSNEGQSEHIHFRSMSDGAQPVLLSCGTEHVFVSLTMEREDICGSQSDQVWGWGWNEHGNLGMGHTDDRHEPVRIFPKESGEAGRLAGIWTGSGTSWILWRTNNVLVS
ncbi:RCC1/BLIP-II [Coprinopsis marcescibilis]|uniref:RCC1/BLIP-II n=1 Tax=Coprinopsis marcescibilis TaxID=230819 RepID=A0A5C3KMA0_COPMA|nr:RCC1/BLIP-II [Coprinopsis marcescibilis]